MRTLIFFLQMLNGFLLEYPKGVGLEALLNQYLKGRKKNSNSKEPQRVIHV